MQVTKYIVTFDNQIVSLNFKSLAGEEHPLQTLNLKPELLWIYVSSHYGKNLKKYNKTF